MVRGQISEAFKVTIKELEWRLKEKSVTDIPDGLTSEYEWNT